MTTPSFTKTRYKEHLAIVVNFNDDYISEHNILTKILMSPFSSKYVVLDGDEVMSVDNINRIVYKLYRHRYNILITTNSSVYPVTPLLNKINRAALRVVQGGQSYLTYNIVALTSAKIPYELICELDYNHVPCAAKIAEVIQYVIAARRLYKGSNPPPTDVILRSKWTEHKTVEFHKSLLEFFSHYVDKEIYIKYHLVEGE